MVEPSSFELKLVQIQAYHHRQSQRPTREWKRPLPFEAQPPPNRNVTSDETGGGDTASGCAQDLGFESLRKEGVHSRFLIIVKVRLEVSS